MQEVKRSLRKRLISERKAIQTAVKASADESIFQQLIPLLNKADTVLTYVSTDIEVDTRRVLQYCFNNDIRVGVPVSGDTELTFYEIRAFSELKDGRYGILEPVDRTEEIAVSGNSLCIVPALCADGNGSRLGYGKGYYDRFLTKFSGKSVIVCYRDFKMEVPAEPHDKKADLTIFDK